MFEDFPKLEKKVNILTQYCKDLKEENKRLKEMLSKNETDMYSLIEEKDYLAKEKNELSKKIDEIMTDNNRINNLIDTIDSAIEGYDTEDNKSTVERVEHKKEIEEIKEEKINHVEESIIKHSPVVPEKNTPDIKEVENKTPITQASSIVHVKEDEDPFSKANDNDWDSDIENINDDNIELGDDELEDIELQDNQVKSTEKKNEELKIEELNNDDYDFEIEDDGYVFSDEDDDEDSGFVFEDEKN